MPILQRWRPLANLPAKSRREALTGIYELADENKVLIYIGQSATDVPNRIRQHLARSECLKDKVVYWRYAYSSTPQSDEAAHITRYQEKYGMLPLCNRATPKVRTGQQKLKERARG